MLVWRTLFYKATSYAALQQCGLSIAIREKKTFGCNLLRADAVHAMGDLTFIAGLFLLLKVYYDTSVSFVQPSRHLRKAIIFNSAQRNFEFISRKFHQDKLMMIMKCLSLRQYTRLYVVDINFNFCKGHNAVMAFL